MTQSQMILYAIKLILGGIAAFCSILLWSKTKDAVWMNLVVGVVAKYAGVVYEILLVLGIIFPESLVFFGIPLTTLIFTALPDIFFITAFILMLKRNK